VRAADALSLARVALTPLLVLAILADRTPLAIALAVVALATDFVDGYLARRNGSSPLGRVLDPLADKLLAAGSLGALLAVGRVPAELVAAVVVRDGVLLAFGWIRLRGGESLPAPNALGKVAFTALGVFMAGAVAGVRWPVWAPGLVGTVYVLAGVSYAGRLPAPFRRTAEGKR
jgi:phosphatidylglycerophosphate synthase